MTRLTETEIAQIETTLFRTMDAINPVPALVAALRDAYDAIDILQAELDRSVHLIAILDDLEAAQARIAALEKAQRWRLPNAGGEWEELPEMHTDVDITFCGVLDVAFVHPLDKSWRFSGSPEIKIAKGFVEAWRPRPAPYVPPEGK
jgi:hypothetical protein